MSRCFPFPPPGYEKKARTDDADLLKKEKQREKRPKKEKRDKEKRESKEKREKEKSDGKHREKKDKKEKIRDKKKEKETDRDKDKDKNIASEEKRFAAQSEGYNGEKLSQNEGKDKDKNSISDQKRFAGQFEGSNGGRLSQNSLPAKEIKDSKFGQELGRRIRDEERGTGNQLVEKFTGTDQKNDEGMVKLVAKDIGTRTEGKEKNKDKRGDDRKMDGRGIRDEARFSGNAMVQNLAGMAQNKVAEMPRPMEKSVERRMEGKEKEVDDKRGDKRKDKDKEKKNQGKDKDRDKEKKKEEKVKEKSEHKSTEQDKLKGSNKNDFIGTHTRKTSHLPKDSDKSSATEGNLRKRKDFEVNGFLHDNNIRPNKLPRPASSSHPLTENGRKLEPCQTSILFTSDRQAAANSHKVDNKERKVNGIIDTQPSSISSTKPPSETVQADQITEVSVKPSHPDLKYLSQVLSVPKMEEWSDFDDQEWLFSNNDPQSKKPKVGSSEVEETPRVWAEALQIESADVCALPYVIPY